MPNLPKNIAKAGTLICVDTGSYSRVMGFFVVLQDFEPRTILEACLADNPEQSREYEFNPDRLLAYFLSKGLLLEIEYGTIHLPSYRYDGFEFTPAQKVTP